jgi:hypothetical protein
MTRRWLFLRWRVRQVAIGQQALNRNFDGRSPAFSQSIKPYLGSQPHRTAARYGAQQYSVREVTRLFLRELLRAASEQLRVPVADLTIPTPVGFYDPHRAELQSPVPSYRTAKHWGMQVSARSRARNGSGWARRPCRRCVRR